MYFRKFTRKTPERTNVTPWFKKEKDGEREREEAFGSDNEIMFFVAFISQSRNVVYRDWTASQECRLLFFEEMVVVSRGNFSFYSRAADPAWKVDRDALIL